MGARPQRQIAEEEVTMPQTYVAKDGTRHEFPDDATPEEIQWAADQIDGFDLGKPIRSDRELFSFNSPYAQETGVRPLKMLWATAKQTFGNDQAAADYLAKEGGGSVQEVDGRPVLVSPSGERYNVNDPGFTVSDAESFAANAAAFTPAGRAALMAPSIGGRMAVGGLATAGTDAALQLATTGRIDPTRAGMAGAFGGGAEALAPAIAGLVRAARTGSMSKQELILRGRNQLQQMQASGVTDETAQRFGRALDQIEAGADPRLVLGEAEFGFRYTQGQKSGAPALLAREGMLRRDQGRAGQVMAENDQWNYDRAIGAVDELQQRITGQRGRVDPAGAAGRAADVVRSEADALRGKVDDAYTRFRDTKAYVGADPQRTLPGRIERALRGIDISPQTTPAGARALKLVGEEFGDPVNAMSAAKIDAFRRRLRSLQGTTGNPTDAKAVRSVVAEFDTWLDETAMQGLVGGDQNAIALLKDARKLRSEFGLRFGDSGPYGKRFDSAVKAMIDGKADPEQLARMIYGTSQVSSVWTNRALLRMNQALGNNPQAKAELQGAVLTKLVEGGRGETITLSQLQSNLRKVMRENPTLVRNLLGVDGAHKLGRLASALDPLVKMPRGASPKMMDNLWRYVTNAATGLPVLGSMVEAIRSAGRVPAASRALQPLAPARAGVVPAVFSTYGQQYGEQKGR
jgi:hypothetical protein